MADRREERVDLLVGHLDEVALLDALARTASAAPESCGHSHVDRHHGSAHVGGFVRSQEHDHRGHLFRLGHLPGRREHLQVLLGIAAFDEAEVLGERRVDARQARPR